MAEQALARAEHEEAFAPRQAAERLLSRRGYLGRPLTPKERVRAIRFLLARGFAPGLVEELLTQGTLSSDVQGE